MSDRPGNLTPNVPEATAQVAQEHDTGAAVAPATTAVSAFPYTISFGVARAACVRPYERRPTDPIYRPLRIYSLDPAQSKLQGAVALVDVPYEPLLPGPIGHLFEVDNHDRARDNVRYAPVDLNEQRTLILNGREPSPSDPQFHQQMVYAVCMSVYAAFKAALGRNIAWGFSGESNCGDTAADGLPPLLRLRLVPHAMREKNACYVRETGEVRFGYFRAGEEIEVNNPRGGYIFTCLSHDVIAHELSHALLDGLREQFLVPTRPDVLAFHEAFGDLVAVFQHFAYQDVVAAAIHDVGPELQRAHVLGDLAKQFGYTAGASGDAHRALRTALDLATADAPPKQYDANLEIHELGSVLVSAVFEAFVTLFRRKTERYVRLATNGSGVLPPGTLPVDLQNVLAGEASQLASQILRCCIRAVDYCPPVDLEFGDYLRAIITADAELIPDDPWAYREALVTAFGRRGIFPTDVRNLAEDSLRWHPPWRPIEIPELHYKRLQFSGDPGLAPQPAELGRQADALGRIVTDDRYFDAFGLMKADGQEFMSPCIQSIRTARRVGPNGQVLFDLVAEVIQERRILLADKTPATFCGGATVIVDPEGFVRYVIVKNVRNERRVDEYRRYVGGVGSKFWAAGPAGQFAPRKHLFQLVHGVKTDWPGSSLHS